MFAWPVPAQTPVIEYGQPDELRGVTRVFVDTGIDAQQRGVVVKEIKKQLPGLESSQVLESRIFTFDFS
jgi:hypothetical protein